MTELNRLTAVEAARMIASGEISSEELVRACLARIREREELVGAWEYLNEELALAAARASDAAETKSALHGVPFGIKDVIDTADMPTQRGTPIHAGRRPKRDATCVAEMRKAGAVALGKTVTTEYAVYHPNKTRNPLNPEHTPGGSSSGSAAAVADFMVPIAFANQTAGSLIRPSAYCGIAGFKPTQGVLDLAGILPMEATFDTLGYMARSFDDIVAFHEIVSGTKQEAKAEPDRAPRIGLCRTYQWSHAEPATVQAMDKAAKELAALGAEVGEVTLPSGFADLPDTHTTMLQVGLSRNLAEDYASQKNRMSDVLRAYLEKGMTCPPEKYQSALAHADECRREVDSAFGRWDVFLTPSVTGEAPRGIAATGSPIFQVMWTLLNVPIATIPGSLGPTGLPVGVQFVGRRGDDLKVLTLANWFHKRRSRTA
ncbi:MAG: hypothetical protein QOK29_4776 [Rhodospirillaceae bacterium]|nr:hypothetical protein [Rhodospirillaceae bacterium]